MRQTLQAAGSKCWMDDDDGRVSQSVRQSLPFTVKLGCFVLLYMRKLSHQ
jgi:hypothetical protein